MTAADRPSVTDDARAEAGRIDQIDCMDCGAKAVTMRHFDQCSAVWGAAARAETTTEWAHMLVGGGASIHRSREAAEQAQRDYLHQQANLYPVDDPPGPPSAGIYRREVTEWKKADQ